MENPFIRLQMALGSDALEKLQKSHIAVFGIGGVGSYTAEALARAGVGAITLVDNDTVGISNLNRQLCALHSTLGKFKAEAMADRIRDINPDCRVRAICKLYTEEDKLSFFDTDYSYIADCIDLVSCKLSLLMNARERQIPTISALGTGNKLDPSQFSITDISKTSGCPLVRVMRKELRNRGVNHHTVLFSPEEPLTPAALEAPPPGRRSIPASSMWVPATAGLLLAQAVILQIAGIDTK
jgi:tRNA A37 threonylcarbamoyladenosine dehydratase